MLMQTFVLSLVAQIERAVRDGFDLRGLMYWTLVDNFEVSSPLWSFCQRLSQQSIVL